MTPWLQIESSPLQRSTGVIQIDARPLQIDGRGNCIDAFIIQFESSESCRDCAKYQNEASGHLMTLVGRRRAGGHDRKAWTSWTAETRASLGGRRWPGHS